MKIENKLEIVLITYNRSKLLENTLDQFLNSPFKDCKITILNNCSTDTTIEVCNSFVNKFSNFKIVTNKLNIGANANIMRAIEIVDLDYIWIVCDDDKYNFSYCDDVIDCIINEKAELINMGAHADYAWSFGGRNELVKKLHSEGYPYFKASSFLPNNIFKKEAFIPFIISGYNNITNMYPHMPFLLSFYSLNKNIYIAKNRIVTAVIGEQVYNSKDVTDGWLNTSRLLKNRLDINRCFFDQRKHKGFRHQIEISLAYTFKSILGKFYNKTIRGIFQILSPFQKIIYIILVIPYVLIRLLISSLKKSKH
ncbi:glycosyltransferase family 2 protein [Flavobacterium limnophilum]|uniref:glycosyltransferase family 2 protein n=1 Tax=Flavobacterium limnophilum TaxID=3003262 RepID=UPI002482A7A0|nr:glycosyltransferase family 2 protein [Flavobacterium limnophilum]